MEYELYKNVAIMYNPLNNKYYFYTDYAKGIRKNYATLDNIKRAIDNLGV